MDAFGAFQTAGLMASGKGGIVTRTANESYLSNTNVTRSITATISQQNIAAVLVKAWAGFNTDPKEYKWTFIVPNPTNIIQTNLEIGGTSTGVTFTVSTSQIVATSGNFSMYNGNRIVIWVGAFIALSSV